MPDTWSEPGGSCRARLRAIPESASFGACRAVLASALIAAFVALPLHAEPVHGAPARPAGIPDDVAERLRHLDCARVTGDDVRDVLHRVPAPRIMLLQGSVPIVTMEPFARFLIDMGYPEDRLRNPHDGGFSNVSFADSERIAGALAFDYERTAEAPMLIGHSQGGALAIRVLHELAGAFHESVPLVDPVSNETLPRTTIVDPYSGEPRPVVRGVRLSFVAALATGWLPRLLLGQWTMVTRLRTIPDTVDEFAGFDLPHDAIAGHLFPPSPYASAGSARVRTTVLPAAYSHVDLPAVDHLAREPATRAWIDGWTPEITRPLPSGDTRNIVHAADIWHSVKQHWCAQAQRLLTLDR